MSDHTLNIADIYAWRYACGKCGSVSLSMRVGSFKESMHRFKDTSAKANFYCNGCNSSINEIYDKKLEKPVRKTANGFPKNVET